MQQNLKLASLFDGSGGFPLAGMFCDIEPVWASEVEPFPIAVTRKRIPQMKHYGDVSTIKGNKVEPVDIITFGSPCFPAGTPVYTHNGYKKIENICVDDYVLTHTGKLKRVSKIGNKIASTIILSDGKTKIECTPNHPFYCLDHKPESLTFRTKTTNTNNNDLQTYWNAANKMQNKFWSKPLISDTNYLIHEWYQVTNVYNTNQEKVVYNIEVEDDHSYIAGGIVVHNCQDLSVAGKRAGLEGERSSLFHESIRIIKEMRKKYGKPRYAVWENVTGAFSSADGADFFCVLREFASVKSTKLPKTRPEMWKYSGQILADTWSLAWRVLDAQFWGVPQRRQRIFLVADFDGGSAPEILFESASLQGYLEQVQEAWQKFAESLRECPKTTSRCRKLVGNENLKLFRNHGQTNDYPELKDKADTVCATYGLGGATKPYVVDMGAGKSNCGVSEGVSPTLSATHGGEPVINDTKNVVMGNTFNGSTDENHSFTITTSPMHNDNILVHKNKLKGNSIGFEPKTGYSNEEKMGTLRCNCGSATGSSAVLTKEDLPKCFVKRASGSCAGDIGDYKESDVSRCLNCISTGAEGCMSDAMVVEKDKTICPLCPLLNDKLNKQKNNKKTYNVRFTKENAKVKRGHCYKCDKSTAITTGKPTPEGNHGGVVVIDNKDSESTTNKEPTYCMTKDYHMTHADKELCGCQVASQAADPPVINDVIEEGAKVINSCVEHENDGVNKPNGVARCLCSGTHGSAPHKTNTICPDNKNKYIVRRLTPQECARLQGFPIWWCSDLGIKEPTKEDIKFWRKVFETYKDVFGGKVSKSENQIKNWIKNPYRDGAEYKMWGNGVALPCVIRVLAGIKHQNSLEQGKN